MPSAPAAVPSLRRLVMPKVAMPSLDSLIRPTDGSSREVDSYSIAASGPQPSAQNDAASVTPPVLVYAPTLRFPDELRARPIDGEVIVQFRVNEKGRVDASTIRIPVAHHDGNYQADATTLDRLEGEGRVAFRYLDSVNGSARNIAGILNDAGNVLGLMPHPERACEDLLGSSDGSGVFSSLAATLAASAAAY